MYHVVQTHPQLVIPTRFGLRDGAPFDPRAFVDADIEYLRAMSDGMDGMVHADDVRRRREPARHRAARRPDRRRWPTWNRTLNDAVVRWHRDAGCDIPDLNELDAQGINLTFFHCFPHYFVLPMYSSASSYRFRPVGSGGDADGDLVARARSRRDRRRAGRRRPRCGSATIHGGRRSPRRTSRTCRGSRRASTRRASSTCGCPTGIEGHISNFQRTIDGFLAGPPVRAAAPGAAARSTCTRSSSRFVDLGF